MKKIKGLIVAPFTAFDKLGKLNLSMIERQAYMYKNNKISGVFICGTTGESSALTMDEKRILFKEWAKYKTADFKVIAFLGGTCVEECIELALLAKECDLDAISLTAPYYFKAANVKALSDFCIDVASSVPDMPFFYYHIPSFTNAYFPMIDLLEEIDGKLPNFAGIKYTYENLMDYQLCLDFKNKKYDILWGRDEMLLGALAMGAQGAVGSTYGYMAPIYNKVFEYYAQKDMLGAQEFQLKANKLICLLNKYGGGTGKAFMKATGLDLGAYRPPVSNLSNEQETEFLNELECLEFYSYCNKMG
ncbi:dihydrodipicolinate synthase family protein [Dysgonomonas sp. 520]|uniref:dihydrodipicolinate synthase family protein n=1 Tax=Dysgonomonas sp. 520 TaxID=2302931 RepID=UPI0013D4C698|nr:dihydrodipicolinate synthase family protein [Dysgonomonas sp. 520]NDW08559.1 dihydrodipicolinate synthetase [Dysgonomonas sp. 520]